MKKKVLCLALTLIMTSSIFMTGCSTGTSQVNDTKSGSEETKDAKETENVSGGDKTTVVFAYWGAESENNAIQATVTDFEANNPDIKVETQWIEEDYLTKVQTQIAGGTTADVYLISAADLPGFAGNFDTQTVDASKYLSENVVDALKIEGELKARPFIVKPKVMAINKDLFKEYGVDIPSLTEPMTMEEFGNDIAKLTDTSKNPQQFGSESPWMGNFVYSFGGSYYKNNGTESNLDSAEDIEAANFIIDAKAKGYNPNNTQSEGQSMMDWFLSGRIAMYTDFGPWYIPQMADVTGFDWDIVPYPANGGNKEVDGLAICSASENKEAAETFAAWLCESDSAQKAIGGDSSAYGVPVNPNAVDSFKNIYEGKNMQAYVDAAFNQTPTETQKRTNEINTVLDRVDDETGVGTGDGNPAEIFPSIAEDINAILKQ
ncbi:MAG: sugar ABC transporter substrate-binding protein [Anaerocolumna sp.]